MVPSPTFLHLPRTPCQNSTVLCIFNSLLYFYSLFSYFLFSLKLSLPDPKPPLHTHTHTHLCRSSAALLLLKSSTFSTAILPQVASFSAFPEYIFKAFQGSNFPTELVHHLNIKQAPVMVAHHIFS